MIDKTKLKSSFKELLRAVVTAIIAFVTALLSSSCGSLTKATIRNGADSTSTTVTITTNNPTNWNLDPTLNLDLKHPKQLDSTVKPLKF